MQLPLAYLLPRNLTVKAYVSVVTTNYIRVSEAAVVSLFISAETEISLIPLPLKYAFWLQTLHSNERSLQFRYSSFQAVRHTAPSLRLFFPSSLTVYQHFFSSEGCACNVFWGEGSVFPVVFFFCARYIRSLLEGARLEQPSDTFRSFLSFSFSHMTYCLANGKLVIRQNLNIN
jgi:hypothetical protein